MGNFYPAAGYADAANVVGVEGRPGAGCERAGKRRAQSAAQRDILS